MYLNPYAASSEVTEMSTNPVVAAPQSDYGRRLATSSCYALGCVIGLHGAIAYYEGLIRALSVIFDMPLYMLMFSAGYAAIAVFSSAVAGRLCYICLRNYKQLLSVRFFVGGMFSIVFMLSHFPVQRYLMDNMNWITDILAGTRLNASTSGIAFLFALVLSRTFEAVVSPAMHPAGTGRRALFKAL